jgi:hypothetical protein
VETTILVRFYFYKPFILDVDWSIKGVKVITKAQEIRTSSNSCKQGSISCLVSFPPNGGRILCSHMGHNLFQAISSPNPIPIMDKSQMIGMVSNYFRCLW